MSPLYRAAADLQQFATESGWPHCIIGGLAVQRWGIERTTRDADMTVLTRFVDDEACIAAFVGRFRPRTNDAAEFALKARVLLLQHDNGVELDIALGGLDFEARSIERASWWDSPSGARLFTCSADDLVVHKAFAARDRDWADVESVVTVQRDRLNLSQIFNELAPLASLKEDASLVPRLERIVRKHNLG